jgi:hypothetical protein
MTLTRYSLCASLCICRYVLYDHAYETADGRPQNKLFFVLWAPPDAPSLSKFGYSSHKTSAAKGLPGVFDVRATCQADLEVLLGITKDDAGADDWDPGAVIRMCEFDRAALL